MYNTLNSNRLIDQDIYLISCKKINECCIGNCHKKVKLEAIK